MSSSRPIILPITKAVWVFTSIPQALMATTIPATQGLLITNSRAAITDVKQAFSPRTINSLLQAIGQLLIYTAVLQDNWGMPIARRGGITENAVDESPRYR